MRCQKCGTPVGKDDLFCQECGSKIEQKSNAKVVIIAAVIMAAIVAGIIFWVMSGSGGKDEDDGRNETKSSDTKDKGSSDESKEKNETKESTESDMVKKPAEEEQQSSGYILPESNSRYLTDADIASLSLRDLNYAKNEIYARHGRRFKSNELQQYFDSQSWYSGQYDPDDFDANYSQSMLNDYEKKNAELLRKKEFSINSGGYPLDSQ